MAKITAPLSSSPVPQKAKKEPTLLTLPQALNLVIDGKKIARYEWESPDVWCSLEGDMLCIFRGDTDKQFHHWSINDGDLLAQDWMEVER